MHVSIGHAGLAEGRQLHTVETPVIRLGRIAALAELAIATTFCGRTTAKQLFEVAIAQRKPRG